MEKGIMRNDSWCAGCRSDAAEEILLADLHAVMAEDVVGGDGMKEEIGQGEIQKIILAGKFRFLAAELEDDRAFLAAVDQFSAKALQERHGLGDAYLQFGKSGLGIRIAGYLDAC